MIFHIAQCDVCGYQTSLYRDENALRVDIRDDGWKRARADQHRCDECVDKGLPIPAAAASGGLPDGPTPDGEDTP